MERRDFLKMMGTGAALSMLPMVSRRAHAQSLRARNLIIVLASGGWDQTVSIDPKVGLSAVDSAVGDVALIGGLPILAHSSRPLTQQFFTDFGDRTAIVNGVQIRSIVHTDGIKRIMTGDPTGLKPDIGALVADQFGREAPIPYLALGPNSLPGPLVGLSGRTGVIQQVTGLVRPEAELPERTPTSALSEGGAGLVTRFLRRRADARTGIVGRVGTQVREYKGGIDRMESFQRFVRDTGAFAEREFAAELGTQANIGVRALKDGLSQTVFMEIGNFDSHTGGDAQQGAQQEQLYSGLHQLMQGLEVEGLTDDTVVLVVSEMGRTPKKNEQQGKDHWPVSSAMVLGGGVRAGVYGASDDTLNASSIDLVSGDVSSSGQQIQPGNLLAGVLQVCGVDPTDSLSHHLSGFQPMTSFIA